MRQGLVPTNPVVIRHSPSDMWPVRNRLGALPGLSVSDEEKGDSLVGSRVLSIL